MINVNAIKVKRLSPIVGGRIEGIELRRPIESETKQLLLNSFAQYSVLCLPNQKIEPDDQIRFAEVFGQADAEIGTKTQSREKVENFQKRGMMFISNLRQNDMPIGELPDGELHFHSDGSHRSRPYRATTLYAIKVTSVGGETKFANMYAAYDALPDQMKQRIEGLEARHVYDKRAYRREETNENDDSLSSAVHKLVRIHPDTGRKSLYLSRLMTRSIIGLDRVESDAMLEELCEHAEKDEFVYAHRWMPDDLLIWDNRCLNHARNNFPKEQERHLRRVTVSGN
jgi:taurine dioxygenase